MTPSRRGGDGSATSSSTDPSTSPGREPDADAAPSLASRLGIDAYLARFDLVTDPARRRVLRAEVIIVLLVTFGLSGIRAVLSLVRAMLDAEPLDEQTAALNVSASTAQILDAAFQITGVVALLAWACLPILLLTHTGEGPRALGLGRGRFGRQVLWGVGLAALIGIPGLAFYLGSVAAGINLTVSPSGLDDTWWRPLVLVVNAFANGAAEEIVVVGYLLVRLRQLGVNPYVALLATALLRGSYHLYQGLGGGLGNLVMGVVFALWWMRTGKVWPLIIAHTLLDVVAFVGYAFLAPHLSWLPGGG